MTSPASGRCIRIGVDVGGIHSPPSCPRKTATPPLTPSSHRNKHRRRRNRQSPTAHPQPRPPRPLQNPNLPRRNPRNRRRRPSRPHTLHTLNLRHRQRDSWNNTLYQRRDRARCSKTEQSGDNPTLQELPARSTAVFGFPAWACEDHQWVCGVRRWRSTY
jgi:hypothetical protein